MAALSVFIGIALGGCAFLFYFLYALWREGSMASRRARVEITKVPSRKLQTGKLIRLYPSSEARETKRL
jgi:threonine/homoserine/homoserine lactone efflux protein